MSKDMGYSARLKTTEEYFGGAAAVARHLAGFSEDVTLMSIIGNEEEMRLKLFDEVSEHHNWTNLSDSLKSDILRLSEQYP